MADLSTQLREYLDLTAPPVELDDIFGEDVRIPAPDRPRRRTPVLPNWAYGVAAMVVVLVVTLGLA